MIEISKFWHQLQTALFDVTYQTRVTVSSGYPNTEKRVENATHSEVFLTTFDVWIADETLSQVNGDVKSSKSLLIKTGYPILLHGCEFLTW